MASMSKKGDKVTVSWGGMFFEDPIGICIEPLDIPHPTQYDREGEAAWIHKDYSVPIPKSTGLWKETVAETQERVAAIIDRRMRLHTWRPQIKRLASCTMRELLDEVQHRIAEGSNIPE